MPQTNEKFYRNCWNNANNSIKHLINGSQYEMKNGQPKYIKFWRAKQILVLYGLFQTANIYTYENDIRLHANGMAMTNGNGYDTDIMAMNIKHAVMI